MNRRTALRGAMLGGAATAAALAIGENPASAAPTPCDCGPTVRCSACQSDGTCPSKWSLCQGSGTSNCFNTQGYRCEWPSGAWVACTGFGTCGNGYRMCYDCINGSDCAHWCTCLGNIVCSGCCSPQEVKAEQNRVQHALAAMH